MEFIKNIKLCSFVLLQSILSVNSSQSAAAADGRSSYERVITIQEFCALNNLNISDLVEIALNGCPAGCKLNEKTIAAIEILRSSEFFKNINPKIKETMGRISKEIQTLPSDGRVRIDALLAKDLEDICKLKPFFALAQKLRLGKGDVIAIQPCNYSHYYKKDACGNPIPWTIGQQMEMVGYLEDPVIAAKLTEARMLIRAEAMKMGKK